MTYELHNHNRDEEKLTESVRKYIQDLEQKVKTLQQELNILRQHKRPICDNFGRCSCTEKHGCIG